MGQQQVDHACRALFWAACIYKTRRSQLTGVALGEQRAVPDAVVALWVVKRAEATRCIRQMTNDRANDPSHSEGRRVGGELPPLQCFQVAVAVVSEKRERLGWWPERQH